MNPVTLLETLESQLIIQMNQSLSRGYLSNSSSLDEIAQAAAAKAVHTALQRVAEAVLNTKMHLIARPVDTLNH